ncbi:hypothetical protein GCM10022225_06950 [Plantactinospora mayteni]
MTASRSRRSTSRPSGERSQDRLVRPVAAGLGTGVGAGTCVVVTSARLRLQLVSRMVETKYESSGRGFHSNRWLAPKM